MSTSALNRDSDLSWTY